MCHTKIDDVTVYVTLVTSELLLSSCVVAQSTGSTALVFIDLMVIQYTSDIVATLGHHFLATISDWPLYPT